MAAFGIDFGTTNSAVAVFSDGEVEVLRIDSPPVEWEQFGYDRVFPSVFGYGENREPLFGWAAKLAETETKIEAVKRLFATEDHVTVGDEQFLVDEIATMLFAQIKRNVAAESGHDLDRAVVTIPANSRGRARQRTKLCAGMGGIEALALMNEPTAAAMAATRRNREDQSVMVIDWGGGTLDVTVLDAIEGTFMEQTSSGIQRCGGLDFDSSIMKWLAESTPGSEGWSGIERSLLR
ncbi:MAG TPA: Hsp70 family protein, partial [Candidatus Handelsmanbacteria bacterium]|nr:Hsp70 family protein [Candidatus Handelsmanbacteria bacterium]